MVMPLRRLTHPSGYTKLTTTLPHLCSGWTNSCLRAAWASGCKSSLVLTHQCFPQSVSTPVLVLLWILSKPSPALADRWALPSAPSSCLPSCKATWLTSPVSTPCSGGRTFLEAREQQAQGSPACQDLCLGWVLLVAQWTVQDCSAQSTPYP